MTASTTALREGLLVDMVGRQRTGDVRSRTVHQLINRFQVDMEHAARVRDTALYLYEMVAADWELGDSELNDFADFDDLGIRI